MKFNIYRGIKPESEIFIARYLIKQSEEEKHEIQISLLNKLNFQSDNIEIED